MAMSLPSASQYDEDALEAAMAHLVIEDERPVDNRFHERQLHLLPDILFASWRPGRPFDALTNVGLFTSLTKPPLVPDFMLVLDLEPRPITSRKADRTYMTWIYGKPPDLVIEVVSNRKGGELTRKLDGYAAARVPFYVVFDPDHRLSKSPLRTFCLTGRRYVETISAHGFPDLGLGFALWQGLANGLEGRWLRFVDAAGELLGTSTETTARAERERDQAEQERDQAEQERDQAEQERDQAQQERDRERQTTLEAEERAKRLAQRLRELGVDPDKL